MSVSERDHFKFRGVSAAARPSGRGEARASAACVIESHATMEHGRVSRAALRAGPATVARMCEPAGPSRGQDRLGVDHESSRAVPPGNVPEDEPDVLY